MPELPDICLYVERLSERLIGQTLESFRTFSPFVLRTASPAPANLTGRAVAAVVRIGKRVVLSFEGDVHAVIHLMIAGRFQWQCPAPAPTRPMGKVTLAAWRFGNGQLSLVETSTRKRASIHLVLGSAGLAEFDRGGLDVFQASSEAFRERLQTKNRTLKRALTDPASFDGIGNAYSDEILFWARLSPVRLTQALKNEEVERLCTACQETLERWRAKLRDEILAFPKPAQITAFRPDFAAHGRFGQPCPVCAAPIQRIVYAENETNYCARCQNEGRLLADRSLSRLLRDDWPRTLEEMVGG